MPEGVMSQEEQDRSNSIQPTGGRGIGGEGDLLGDFIAENWHGLM